MPCSDRTSPHLENALDANQWLKLRRIICAVALDWETDGILKESADLANQLRAQLVAMQVITPLQEGFLPLIIDAAVPISSGSALSAMQRALDLTRVTAQVEILLGEASRRVASAAKEYDADLIVIRKGGRQEFPGRLGSHTYAIVRRAPGTLRLKKRC